MSHLNQTDLDFKEFKASIYLLLQLRGTYAHYGVHVAVRGHLEGAGSLLPAYEPWRMSSGRWAL